MMARAEWFKSAAVRITPVIERTLGSSPTLRLLAWAQSRVGRPFKWGQTNCLMLCLEAVDVLRGSDLAGAWRSKCNNIRDVIRNTRRLDAAAELRKAGFIKINTPPKSGDLIIGLPPHYRQFSGHVVLGDHCLSSTPQVGVGYAWVRDALRGPNVSVWRMVN